MYNNVIHIQNNKVISARRQTRFGPPKGYALILRLLHTYTALSKSEVICICNHQFYTKITI